MSGGPNVSTARRRGAMAGAALLLVGVAVLGLLVDDPRDSITILFVLPIALVAVELGVAWGLTVATLALALFAAWDLAWNPGDVATPVDYATRAVAFFVLGGAAGAVSDRLRTVWADSSRFWELSADLLCTAGVDGYYRRLNPAWETTLGWTRAELRAAPLAEFIHPEDRDRVLEEIALLGRPGHQTIGFECRHRCRDGTYRSVVWGAGSVAELGVIYATGRDVTASKLAQEELRESERFLDSILEHVPSMVFVKDAETLEFVRFNRAGEEMLGLSRASLIGRTDHDLFPPYVADAFVRKDRDVLASGEALEIPEEVIETSGQGRRILQTWKVPIHGEDGAPRYLLGVSNDITVRKEAENAAEAARAEAARANQAKSEFLSRMSHELRTPLNAILGFGQLLALDDLDRDGREAVEQILAAGHHLLALVNEVLDMARIEAGSMSVAIAPVHVDGVVEESCSLVKPLADQAGVQLRVIAPRNPDAHVLADRQRLKQVLINLLSNAVKYNRPGGEVLVVCAELPDRRHEIAVTDTGHGMSNEAMTRLYAPFERLGSEDSDIEGTGLGLALSRGLVEAMGGDIRAESVLGTGTTMRVRLEADAESGP